MKSQVTFKWTEKRQEAFETLKERFMFAPVLVNYQPDLPLVLVTDMVVVPRYLVRKVLEISYDQAGHFVK